MLKVESYYTLSTEGKNEVIHKFTTFITRKQSKIIRTNNLQINRRYASMLLLK